MNIKIIIKNKYFGVKLAYHFLQDQMSYLLILDNHPSGKLEIVLQFHNLISI